MNVILVDDDAVIRQAVVNCFSGDPETEVVLYERAAEVLEHLARNHPAECLLVDWNMPEMTGYELVCAVRAEAKYKDIRIVMLTSESSLGHVRKALEAGADDYLMKPFTKQMLLEKIALLGRI